MLNIANIVTDNTNLIEIYPINKYNNCKIELKKNNILIDKILNKYKFKISSYKSYYKNNLIYTYDLSNDSQFITDKKFEYLDITDDNIAILLYNDCKLATNIFACTNNIDHVVEYILYEYKLNNRISLIIRKENSNKIIYIQYKHSNIVDIEKMELIINSLIKELE